MKFNSNSFLIKFDPQPKLLLKLRFLGGSYTSDVVKLRWWPWWSSLISNYHKNLLLLLTEGVRTLITKSPLSWKKSASLESQTASQTSTISNQSNRNTTHRLSSSPLKILRSWTPTEQVSNTTAKPPGKHTSATRSTRYDSRVSLPHSKAFTRPALHALNTKCRVLFGKIFVLLLQLKYYFWYYKIFKFQH